MLGPSNCLDSGPLHFSIRGRVLRIIEHIILHSSMQKTALLSAIHRYVILIHYNILLLLLNILLYVYIILFLYYMIFEKICFYLYYYTFFIFIFFDGYFYENNVLLYP